MLSIKKKTRTKKIRAKSESKETPSCRVASYRRRHPLYRPHAGGRAGYGRHYRRRLTAPSGAEERRGRVDANFPRCPFGRATPKSERNRIDVHQKRFVYIILFFLFMFCGHPKKDALFLFVASGQTALRQESASLHPRRRGAVEYGVARGKERERETHTHTHTHTATTNRSL